MSEIDDLRRAIRDARARRSRARMARSQVSSSENPDDPKLVAELKRTLAKIETDIERLEGGGNGDNGGLGNEDNQRP